MINFIIKHQETIKITIWFILSIILIGLVENPQDYMSLN
jgi:hypothetical protein